MTRVSSWERTGEARDVEGGWGSRVMHSVSWHLWLARMFRMVFSPSSISRLSFLDVCRSSLIHHGFHQLDPTRRVVDPDEREKRYGSCSRFLESLISVLLVLFPCCSSPAWKWVFMSWPQHWFLFMGSTYYQRHIDARDDDFIFSQSQYD